MGEGFGKLLRQMSDISPLCSGSKLQRWRKSWWCIAGFTYVASGERRKITFRHSGWKHLALCAHVKTWSLREKPTWGEQVNGSLCIFQPQEWSAACTKGGNYGSFPLVACKVLCFYIIKPQNIMIAVSISVQLIHPMPISSAVHQLSTQSEDFQLIFQNIFSLLHLL